MAGDVATLVAESLSTTFVIRRLYIQMIWSSYYTCISEHAVQNIPCVFEHSGQCWLTPLVCDPTVTVSCDCGVMMKLCDSRHYLWVGGVQHRNRNSRVVLGHRVTLLSLVGNKPCDWKRHTSMELQHRVGSCVSPTDTMGKFRLSPWLLYVLRTKDNILVRPLISTYLLWIL
jgi:hypothetical protein